MVSYLLLLALGSVVVTANTMDGQSVRGELKALSAAGAVVSVDGTPREFVRSRLRNVLVSEEAVPQQSHAQLSCGSIVPFDALQLSSGTFKLKTSGGMEISAPDQAVRSVRWISSGEQLNEQWSDIASESDAEDLLVIRRGENLDYLKGTIDSVGETTIGFVYNGDTIQAPRDRVAGFILARQSAEQPTPRLILKTLGGAQWMLRSATLTDDRLEFVSMSNVQGRVSLAELGQIEFPQLGVAYLSELSPESTVFQPFLGSQLDASLQQLYGPRLDRDLNGNSLRLWDPTVASGIREYQRGLAMQSRSELVYRLASKYQRFEASVGIDPDAASQADVDLRIYLDDRRVFERSISKADPVIRIDLDVSSANRMKLVVDYGRAMDIGDRLHLCDARLTK